MRPPPDRQCRDLVRGNLRLGGGWAEMPTRCHRFFEGVPQEPIEKGGMYRLPVMSAALRIVQQLPIGPGGACSVVEDLQATAGRVAWAASTCSS